MLRRLLRASVAAATLLVGGVPALTAQVPGLTTSFAQPTGVGSPTDVFDVNVRLTLDANAPPLNFDGTSPGTLFGLPAGVLPTFGNRRSDGAYVQFATYSSAFLSTSLSCSGNFFGTPGNACGPGAYRFDFLGFLDDPFSFSLAPGGTFDFPFLRLTPQGTGALPGTYRFYFAATTLFVYGQDALGNEVVNSGDNLFSSATCTVGDDDCAFTRTVIGSVAVVPEPATGVLFASAAATLAGWAVVRRRRQP